MQEFNNTQQQKILELLYTGEPANDLLAFEIIKQLKVDNEFYLTMICLAMIIEDRTLISEILQYLSTSLTPQHKAYLILFDLEKPPHKKGFGHGLTTLFVRQLKEIPFLYKEGKKIEDYFSKQEISELIFFNAKRTGKGSEAFFENNEDECLHPKRVEMLNLYLEKRKEGIFRVPYLFTDEIEILFENIVSQSSEFQLLNMGIQVNKLREDRLPSNVLDFLFKGISLGDSNLNFSLTHIPSFIFDFKKIRELFLCIKDSKVLNQNWKYSTGIKFVNIIAQGDCEISNLDGFKTLYNLSILKINGAKVPNPDYLLEMPHYSFVVKFSELRFSSIKNYNIHVDQSFSDFQFALKLIRNTNLSINEKRKYLEKVLNRKQSVSDINALSIEDMEALWEKADAYTKLLLSMEIKNKNAIKQGK